MLLDAVDFLLGQNILISIVDRQPFHSENFSLDLSK